MRPEKRLKGQGSVQRGSKALPGLTGVRGIAAMAVFLCHFQPIALRFSGIDEKYGLTAIANGFRGVDLFFILSGFILFHVHSNEVYDFGAIRTTRFYTLRFFRVYPLNTVVLLALLALTLLLPQFADWHRAAYLSQGAYHLQDYSFWAFVQSLLLVQTWTGLKLGTWNEPAWTLSAEVLGYILFPVLAPLVCRRTSASATAMLAAAGLTAFVLLMILGGHATNNPSGTFGIIRMFFCFAAGMCLCRTGQLLVMSRAAAASLTLASAVMTVLCLSIDTTGILSVFAFAGLIFGLSCEAGPVSDLMTARPVMFLGRISFSFYIIHLIPLDLFAWLSAEPPMGLPWYARIAALVMLVVLTVLLASLTYRFVEKPFQRLGRRVAAHPVAVPRMGEAV